MDKQSVRPSPAPAAYSIISSISCPSHCRWKVLQSQGLEKCNVAIAIVSRDAKRLAAIVGARCPERVWWRSRRVLRFVITVIKARGYVYLLRHRNFLPIYYLEQDVDVPVSTLSASRKRPTPPHGACSNRNTTAPPSETRKPLSTSLHQSP